MSVPTQNIDLRPHARSLGQGIALWIALIYAGVGLLYVVAPPVQPALPLASAAMLSAAFMVALRYLVARAADRWVFALCAAAAACGTTFALTFVGFTGDLEQSVVLVMSLLAVGCFLYHLPSLLLIVAASLGCWALLTRGADTQQQLHWAINLVVTAGLSVLVCWARVRTMVRLEIEKAEAEGARIELARQAAELESARDTALASVRAKAEFLSNMTHELRTPLGGIIGLSEMLLQGSLDRDQRDSVESVRMSGEALLAVIDDLLDFSRVEAGRIRAEVSAVRLHELVEDSVAGCRRAAANKGLHLKVQIAADVPRVVDGAGPLLVRVLDSLIANAIKFTAHGGVEVEVSKCAEGTLRFDVRDTGIGIAPADRERIWDAFVQADGTASRRFEGAGLGLAICRGLVELMGGTISVESELGRGSTFSVELPMSAGEVRAASPRRLVGAA